MGQRLADYSCFPFGIEPLGNMLRHTTAAGAKIFARRHCPFRRIRQTFQHLRDRATACRTSECGAHLLSRQRAGDEQLRAIVPGDSVTAAGERFYGQFAVHGREL